MTANPTNGFNQALAQKWRNTDFNHPIKQKMTFWRALLVARELTSTKRHVGKPTFFDWEYELVGKYLQEESTDD